MSGEGCHRDGFADLAVAGAVQARGLRAEGDAVSTRDLRVKTLPRFADSVWIRWSNVTPSPVESGNVEPAIVGRGGGKLRLRSRALERRSAEGRPQLGMHS